jgi:hypothetical protein
MTGRPRLRLLGFRARRAAVDAQAGGHAQPAPERERGAHVEAVREVGKPLQAHHVAGAQHRRPEERVVVGLLRLEHLLGAERPRGPPQRALLEGGRGLVAQPGLEHGRRHRSRDHQGGRALAHLDRGRGDAAEGAGDRVVEDARDDESLDQPPVARGRRGEHEPAPLLRAGQLDDARIGAGRRERPLQPLPGHGLGPTAAGAVVAACGLEHRLGVHLPRHVEHDVRRAVAGPVVAQDVIPPQAGDRLRRPGRRVDSEDLPLEGLGRVREAAGGVLGDLLEDDAALLLELLGRQRRPEQHVGLQLEHGVEPLGGTEELVGRELAPGEGVAVEAEPVRLAVQLLLRPRLRPVEAEVLQEVGGPQAVRALVHGAGAHDGRERDCRHGIVGADDDERATGQLAVSVAPGEAGRHREGGEKEDGDWAHGTHVKLLGGGPGHAILAAPRATTRAT